MIQFYEQNVEVICNFECVEIQTYLCLTQRSCLYIRSEVKFASVMKFYERQSAGESRGLLALRKIFETRDPVMMAEGPHLFPYRTQK